ncbi:MAG: prepilin-type N-terminal cleavage/methylation domain-containing protein [Desulfobacterales bacterium]
MSSLLLKFKKSQHVAKLSPGGFTLIEVLITIAMISIFIPAMYSVYMVMSRSMTTQSVVADVQQSVRFSLDFMVQDIRMAGFDPYGSVGLGTAEAGIEEATATKIRFTADQNMDGVINDANQERVTYLLDAPNNQLDLILYEGAANQNTQALIENVRAFDENGNSISPLTFRYFDKDDNPIATPVAAADLPNIKEIDISLTAEAPAGQKGMISRTFNVRIRGRNL